MNTKNNVNDSERFVARHYKRGAFSERQAWQRMGIVPVVRRWYRSGMVASVAVMVVIAASACIYFVKHSADTRPANTISPTVQTTSTPASAQADRVIVIEFTDAPLTDVVARIEAEYGVKVENVPAETYKLTLRYEGNAADLIDTINELLNTNLTIADE